ncbi:MAG: hypothetical protein U5K32_12995 [Bacteroidales bacterium]|nr:hypothetical protein [Bacteroidales bacterium]
MSKIRKYKYFILLVTVPVLLLFITNSLVNRHNHLIKGYEYSHAHPFDKQESGNQPYPLHGHTDAELVTLDLLSNIIILVGLILFTLFIALRVSDLVGPTSYGLPAVRLISLCSPRAPPACS